MKIKLQLNNKMFRLKVFSLFSFKYLVPLIIIIMIYNGCRGANKVGSSNTAQSPISQDSSTTVPNTAQSPISQDSSTTVPNTAQSPISQDSSTTVPNTAQSPTSQGSSTIVPNVNSSSTTKLKELSDVSSQNIFCSVIDNQSKVLNTSNVFNIEVSAISTSRSLKVRCSGGYTTTVTGSSAMNCSVSPRTNNSNNEQNVTVSFNNNLGYFSTRSCTVKFTHLSGAVLSSVTLNQASDSIIIKANTDDTITLTNRIIKHSTTKTSFRILAFGGYTSSITNTDGIVCTVSPSSNDNSNEKDVTVFFKANTTMSMRSCIVKFTSVTKANISKSLTIQQYGQASDGNANGLIDIWTQEEFLNMQHNLAGTSYKTSASNIGVATGCPATGCNGYELLNEIRFGFATSCGQPAPLSGSGYVSTNISLPGYTGTGMVFSYDSSYIEDTNTTLLYSIGIVNSGYGHNTSEIPYRIIIGTSNFIPATLIGNNGYRCNFDITQPTKNLAGFHGIFEGNGHFVSGLRITNAGARVTSASVFFPGVNLSNIRNVTFR